MSSVKKQCGTVKGIGFELTPVMIEDAEFIYQLRSNPVRARFLNRGATTINEQKAWILKYLAREGDFYFIIHDSITLEPQGTIGIYDIDLALRRAEWGRWLLIENSLAAVESCRLIYRFAFECLKLHELYCRTIKDNKAVVSFHDSCGVQNRSVLPNHFELDSKQYDAVEHIIGRDEWPLLDCKLTRLSKGICRSRS
jgi:RimJ/RimL family protein N-acetyltransferase